VTYHSKVEGSRVYRLPIYYLEVKASYIKRKVWSSKDTWVVTTIENKNDILREDPKTRGRLIQFFYGFKYKSEKAIRIDEVYTKKQVGFTNRTYDELTPSQKRNLNED